MASQPSDGIAPKSHCSLPAKMPSPQAAASHGSPGNGQDQPGSSVHVSEQPSPAGTFPSSHCSLSLASTWPSPHLASSGESSAPAAPPLDGTTIMTLPPCPPVPGSLV